MQGQFAQCFPVSNATGICGHGADTIRSELAGMTHSDSAVAAEDVIAEN